MAFWMPPMKRILELEKLHGITGMGETVLCEGDIGLVEHMLHELAHAATLDIVIEGEPKLSAAISSEVASRAEAQQSEDVAAKYELEAFAVENLVIDRLGIPVTLPEIIGGLELQVGNVLDNPVARFADALSNWRGSEAVDRVCELIAPGGRPPLREGAEFMRLAESGLEITVYPMAFGNARLCIGEPGDEGMLNAWCYQSDGAGAGLTKAIWGARRWNGEGDDPPGGWYRNPLSGRRRPGGDPTKEVRWA